MVNSDDFSAYPVTCLVCFVLSLFFLLFFPSVTPIFLFFLSIIFSCPLCKCFLLLVCRPYNVTHTLCSFENQPWFHLAQKREKTVKLTCYSNSRQTTVINEHTLLKKIYKILHLNSNKEFCLQKKFPYFPYTQNLHWSCSMYTLTALILFVRGTWR